MAITFMSLEGENSKNLKNREIKEGNWEPLKWYFKKIISPLIAILNAKRLISISSSLK